MRCSANMLLALLPGALAAAPDVMLDQMLRADHVEGFFDANPLLFDPHTQT